MTEPNDKTKTMDEVRQNLEDQLKVIDAKIEKAVSGVDKLTAKRARMAILLEKFTQVNQASV